MKRTLCIMLAALTVLTLALTCFVSCDDGAQTDISGAKTISDLKGTKISAQAGTFHEKARKQIEGVKGIVYNDFNSMLVALRSGAIDGYIAEEPTALDVCRKDTALDYIRFVNNDTGFKADDGDVAIAVGCKKGSDLVEKINAVLAGITTEQKMALMEQIIKVNAGEKLDGKFAVSSDKTDTSNGTLKVAMECAYAPFNITAKNSDNGAVAISGEGSTGLYANGYDVQIAKYIAAELGMKLEIYAEKWESLISGVKAGTFDCIIAGMSPTDERKEEIDFTSPYYTSNLVVIYKKKAK